MGNKYTKDSVELHSTHPNFKNAKVITEKDQRHIQTVIPTDDEGYSAWKKLLGKHEKALAKSGFLLLPKNHTLNKQGLCAHTGNAVVDYDYFPYILSQQIANRHQKQQRFRQSDLWYLLYSLVGAKQEVHGLGQRVGDIRPQNVFINYDGLVKVGGLFSYPNQHSSYDKAKDGEHTLLAPEDVDKLQLGAQKNQQNEQSQIFSIGLTVIAAGILQNPDAIYHGYKGGFVFDRNNANDFINKWRNSKHYSQIFRSIIANLVRFNPEQRLTASELWQFVSKYEINIKSKEKFLITSVPPKIERQVGQLRKVTKSSSNTKQHQTYEHPKEQRA